MVTRAEKEAAKAERLAVEEQVKNSFRNAKSWEAIKAEQAAKKEAEEREAAAKAAEEKRNNKWYRRVAKKAMALFAAVTTSTAVYPTDSQSQEPKSPDPIVVNKEDTPKDAIHVKSDEIIPGEPKEAENTEPEFEAHQENENKQTQATDNTQEEVKYHGSSIAGAFRGNNRTGSNTTFTLGSSSASVSYPRREPGFTGGIAPKETPEQKALRETARAKKRITEILALNREKKDISFADYMWVFNYCQNNPGNDGLRNVMRTSALHKMKDVTNNKTALSKGDAYRMEELIKAVRATLDENNPNDNGNLTTVANFENATAEIKKASEMQAKLDEYNAIPAWRRWMSKKPEAYVPLEERTANVDKMFENANLDFNNRDNYAKSFGTWLKVVREHDIKVGSEEMEFALAKLPKGKENDTIRYVAEMAVKDKWPLTKEGKVDRFSLDRTAQVAYAAAESHTYGGDKKTEKVAEPKKSSSKGIQLNHTRVSYDSQNGYAVSHLTRRRKFLNR